MGNAMTGEITVGSGFCCGRFSLATILVGSGIVEPGSGIREVPNFGILVDLVGGGARYSYHPRLFKLFIGSNVKQFAFNATKAMQKDQILFRCW